MKRAGILAAALGLGFAAGTLTAQIAPPTSPPTAASRASTSSKTPKVPLDFSGVWEIDRTQSRGVSKNMESAVLSVRQNGDRIWLEPVEQKKPYLVSEEIVVDGQLYEKAMGAGRKGTVQAQWGKDKKSLWIQATTGSEENPNGAIQRTVWRLREGGKVWTRQTWTVQKGEQTRESFLVFRKRDAKKQ
jgi:hypothetical protein